MDKPRFPDGRVAFVALIAAVLAIAIATASLRASGPKKWPQPPLKVRTIHIEV